MLDDKHDIIASFLESEDAKTRKNAALLIGDLGYRDLSGAIFKAYETDVTRFVKGSYLAALAQLEVPELVPQLEAHRSILEQTELTEDNRKHIE